MSHCLGTHPTPNRSERFDCMVSWIFCVSAVFASHSASYGYTDTDTAAEATADTDTVARVCGTTYNGRRLFVPLSLSLSLVRSLRVFSQTTAVLYCGLWPACCQSLYRARYSSERPKDRTVEKQAGLVDSRSALFGGPNSPG